MNFNRQSSSEGLTPPSLGSSSNSFEHTTSLSKAVLNGCRAENGSLPALSQTQLVIEGAKRESNGHINNLPKKPEGHEYSTDFANILGISHKEISACMVYGKTGGQIAEVICSDSGNEYIYILSPGQQADVRQIVANKSD